MDISSTIIGVNQEYDQQEPLITITLKQVYTANVINIQFSKNTLLPDLKEVIKDPVRQYYNLNPDNYDLVQVGHGENAPAIDLTQNIPFSEIIINSCLMFYIRPTNL